MRGRLSSRLARLEDAPAIAALEAGSAEDVAEDGACSAPLPALGTWQERLALPAGDDHFVLAAHEGTRLVGFARAGGSRDHDGKGDGELYQVCVRAGAPAARALETLVEACLARLVEAGFARMTCWVPAQDRNVRAALLEAGLTEDREGDEGPGPPAIRYARPLAPAPGHSPEATGAGPPPGP